MIKKTLIFVWTFVKQLVVYTLSVIPASFTDAVDAVRDDKNVGGYLPPVKFEHSEQHRRKRRGHRGGRKHRKFHH